jgi:hypothetical protein
MIFQYVKYNTHNLNLTPCEILYGQYLLPRTIELELFMVASLPNKVAFDIYTSCLKSVWCKKKKFAEGIKTDFWSSKNFLLVVVAHPQSNHWFNNKKNLIGVKKGLYFLGKK